MAQRLNYEIKWINIPGTCFQGRTWGHLKRICSISSTAPSVISPESYFPIVRHSFGWSHAKLMQRRLSMKTMAEFKKGTNPIKCNQQSIFDVIKKTHFWCNRLSSVGASIFVPKFHHRRWHARGQSRKIKLSFWPDDSRTSWWLIAARKALNDFFDQPKCF